MKKLRQLLAMLSVAAIMLTNVGVFAEPEEDTQEKYGSGTSKIINTVNNDTDEDNEGETKNATSKTSSKKTSKTTEKTESKSEKSTEKESEMKTEKTSEKSEEKTTEKKTTTKKTTEKAEKKSETKTVATIKPTEKSTTKEDSKKEETKKEDTDKSDDEETKDAENEENEDEEKVKKASPVPTINNRKNAEQINAKKYLTKAGAFGMFLLTVLVSAIVSFLISYRFYKMKKTDNYLSSEIRALKRDIDTKMAGLVNSVSQYETKTSNSNPDYSAGDKSLGIEEQSDSEEEAVDMYSKWERQINSRDNGKNNSDEQAMEDAKEYNRFDRNRRDQNQRNDRYSKTRKNSKFGNSKGKGMYPDRFSRDK